MRHHRRFEDDELTETFESARAVTELRIAELEQAPQPFDPLGRRGDPCELARQHAGQVRAATGFRVALLEQLCSSPRRRGVSDFMTVARRGAEGEDPARARA